MPSWHEVIEVVGNEAAEAITREYGGVRIYVPSREQVCQSPLYALLGEQPARALAREYGPGHLDIPTRKNNGILNAQRAQVLKAEGLSACEIARQLGMTRRWVFELLRRNASNDRQKSMF